MKALGTRVVAIEDKLGHLRWFGHIKRRLREALVRRVEHIVMEERKKKRGRPKFTWEREYDLQSLQLIEDLGQNRGK